MTTFPFPTRPIVDSTNGWEELNLPAAGTMYLFTAAKYQASYPACAILCNKGANTVELRFDAPGAAWAANGQSFNLVANSYICLPSLSDIQNLRMICRVANNRVGISYRRIGN